jgi:hypothetical protein
MCGGITDTESKENNMARTIGTTLTIILFMST